MAIFKNSTFGNIRKSIGDDVAYRMGGQNIIRKKPLTVRDPKTKLQRQRRSALAEIVKLFRRIRNGTANGFAERLRKHSVYNAFSSVNLKEAVALNGNQARIMYPKLVLSKGSLPSPSLKTFTSSAVKKAKIDFNPNTDGVRLFDNDRINIVAVPEDEKYTAEVVEGQIDQNGTVNFTSSIEKSGVTLAMFAFFTSKDGSKSSDSVFLGIVTT